ncbi:MAG: hypothetical protein JWR26_3375 [Pedosphaera sp.]|nr:hypothetical protein [Pedosphaera sp.]
MLRTFHANEYVQPADRGLNRPILLRGKTDAGEDASIFVKTRAGYGDRPAAPGIELFTTLLARELELIAPEPVLVQIPPGFENVVFDAADYRALIQQSHGINFGTVALSPDWKTWPEAMSARAFPQDTIGDILAFDALVQHTDRYPDNPNMLWRNREIAILDHEKCFGHLVLAPQSQHPWREFLKINPFQNHTLRRSLQTDDTPPGRRLWQNLIGLETEGRIPQLVQTVRGIFPESGVELDRILHYFTLLNMNLADFFAYFRASIDK